MAMNNHDQPQPTGDQFSRVVLELIGAEISRSLSKAQAEWAWQAFERYILPGYFRQGEPEDEAELKLQAQIVAGDINEEWQGLSGVEKWAWMLRKTYLARLQPLYEAAWRLAEAKSSQTPINETELQRARDTLDTLQIMRKQMQTVAPHTLKELSEVISEIQMNCKYALGQGEGTSLEINRNISRMD
jgi:hypothetical protein